MSEKKDDSSSDEPASKKARKRLSGSGALAPVSAGKILGGEMPFRVLSGGIVPMLMTTDFALLRLLSKTNKKAFQFALDRLERIYLSEKDNNFLFGYGDNRWSDTHWQPKGLALLENCLTRAQQSCRYVQLFGLRRFLRNEEAKHVSGMKQLIKFEWVAQEGWYHNLLDFYVTLTQLLPIQSTRLTSLILQDSLLTVQTNPQEAAQTLFDLFVFRKLEKQFQLVQQMLHFVLPLETNCTKEQVVKMVNSWNGFKRLQRLGLTCSWLQPTTELLDFITDNCRQLEVLELCQDDWNQEWDVKTSHFKFKTSLEKLQARLPNLKTLVLQQKYAFHNMSELRFSRLLNESKQWIGQGSINFRLVDANQNVFAYPFEQALELFAVLHPGGTWNKLEYTSSLSVIPLQVALESLLGAIGEKEQKQTLFKRVQHVVIVHADGVGYADEEKDWIRLFQQAIAKKMDQIELRNPFHAEQSIVFDLANRQVTSQLNHSVPGREEVWVRALQQVVPIQTFVHRLGKDDEDMSSHVAEWVNNIGKMCGSSLRRLMTSRVSGANRHGAYSGEYIYLDLLNMQTFVQLQEIDLSRFLLHDSEETGISGLKQLDELKHLSKIKLWLKLTKKSTETKSNAPECPLVLFSTADKYTHVEIAMQIFGIKFADEPIVFDQLKIGRFLEAQPRLQVFRFESQEELTFDPSRQQLERLCLPILTRPHFHLQTFQVSVLQPFVLAHELIHWFKQLPNVQNLYIRTAGNIRSHTPEYNGIDNVVVNFDMRYQKFLRNVLRNHWPKTLIRCTIDRDVFNKSTPIALSDDENRGLQLFHVWDASFEKPKESLSSPMQVSGGWPTGASATGASATALPPDPTPKTSSNWHEANEKERSLWTPGLPIPPDNLQETAFELLLSSL